MNNFELLSPVGDFECLKAAVQNGADSVYLGASQFSARASAKNFNIEELKEAIKYAKLRGVNVHLTLNTLLQEGELTDALNLANTAYSFGVDAIIVQDLGLANLLIKNFPDLPIHASTQMTIHNLEGVKLLEELGFKRVVLARELSLEEIKHICKNSNIEIEVFMHGALCISYSGRCYISSLIGGRSGNRGKCAQSCRLPYELHNSSNLIDKGYLLSPRDLYSLKHLPELIHSGVSCFKIEGRMKTPEYVATVTRIYRKYMDLVKENKEYKIDPNDIKDLMQVFNRGGFSEGHLNKQANKKLIYPVRPNNIGLELGRVTKFQASKGYIELNPKEQIEIGDTISFEKENTKYTISELMHKGSNIKNAKNIPVTIGRMKGNINIGDKIYKMSSASLNKIAKNSYEKEYKKNYIDAKITIKENAPIKLIIGNIEVESDIIPEKAQNHPITKEKIDAQLRKTGNTPYEFKNIEIDLGDNLYLPSISALNELRRTALGKLEEETIKNFTRKQINIEIPDVKQTSISKDKKISILLNNIDKSCDYSNLEVNYVYIPLKYYLDKEYEDIIKQFETTYIYLPSIIRKDTLNYIKASVNKATQDFNISGFVVSNLGDLEWLPKGYKYIANYTLNVFNNQTKSKLESLGLNRITSSFELPKDANLKLDSNNLESVVYGRLPVMTLNYCLLGKANHCYNECPKFCKKDKYYIRDRMNFDFPLIADNIGTITTIYNSKTTSIIPSETNASIYRIDIFDENIDQIHNIIAHVKQDSRLEGKEYTNGNLNREI